VAGRRESIAGALLMARGFARILPMVRMLLLALAMLAASAGPADACSCAWEEPGSPAALEQRLRQQFEHATAVFAGEVVAVTRYAATFRVERVWKGTPAEVITLGTSRRMGDGLMSTNTCTLDFRGAERRTYLVFASVAEDGRLSAHRCGATGEFPEAAATEAVLRRFVSPKLPAESPVIQDRDPILAELEMRLAPVAAWRERADRVLRPIAGTPRADREFLALRRELQEVVATLATALETPEFQMRIWPDGFVGQGLRRSQKRTAQADAAEVVRADALAAFMKARGVWPQRGEGDTYFYPSESVLLEWLGPLVSEQIRQFLRLWADEQARPVAEDAAIMVPRDELERRILATERFLADFPESPVQDPVRVRHGHYLALYLGGTDNSRAFDMNTGVFRLDLRQALEAFAAAHPGTWSARTVAEYLEALRASDFRRTPDVVRFLDRVRGDPRDWLLLRY
jgi:hypothetical protein